MSALDGVLEAIDEASIQHMPWRDYDLIFLDAGVFSDLPSTISRIRSQDPEARIIVFSSAPTWKQAREVMLAGSVDYARKSTGQRIHPLDPQKESGKAGAALAALRKQMEADNEKDSFACR